MFIYDTDCNTNVQTLIYITSTPVASHEQSTVIIEIGLRRHTKHTFHTSIHSHTYTHIQSNYNSVPTLLQCNVSCNYQF